MFGFVRGISNLRIIFLSLVAIGLLISTLETSEAYAERRVRKVRVKRFRTRNLNRFNTSNDINAYPEFDLGDTFERMLSTNVDPSSYDPLTIESLKRLKEIAQPHFMPDDVDYRTRRRVGEKALAIQTGQTISRFIQNSELKDTYHDLKKQFEGLQGWFKYSFRDEGGGSYGFSRNGTGKKLVEFSFDINLKQGIDPQVKFGDSVRLRYDYTGKKAMMEYAVDF